MRNVSTVQGLTYMLTPAEKFDGTLHSNTSCQPSLSSGPPPRHDTLPVATARRGGGRQRSLAAHSLRRLPPHPEGLPSSLPRLRQLLSPGPPRTASPAAAPPLSRRQPPVSPFPPLTPLPPFSLSADPLPGLLPQRLALGH